MLNLEKLILKLFIILKFYYCNILNCLIKKKVKNKKLNFKILAFLN